MVARQTRRGLGMSWQLSRFLGRGFINITATGSTGPSAASINGEAYNANVIAGTSGVILPPVGGDINTISCDIGDQFTVTNATAAAIVVYAPGTMTFIGAGVSTTGSVGVSIGSLSAAIFNVSTISTYSIK